MFQNIKMANFSLTHIERMTNSMGMLEHCIFSTPDRTKGYSTDDNARALQAVLRLNTQASEEYTNKYLSIYLQFLLSARTPKGFHQDFNANLTWEDDAGVEEGFGRAMAALGEASLTAPQIDQQLTAAFVFDQQALLIKSVKYIRVMAQVIIALSYRLRFETTASELAPLLIMRKKLKGDMTEKSPINMQTELIHFADELVASYKKHSSHSWNWYEDGFTYDNGRLPLSLFFAFQTTKDQKYLEVAKESLDFLLAQTYDKEKDCFSFPGYRGWFYKNKKKALFGQQPIEAGTTVEVCALAYEVTHEKKYLDYAKKALEWYHGRNILKITMVNPATGGVKDGLEEWGVNPNEGAESVLSYALACLALKKAV